MNDTTYAGDKTPTEAWELLGADASAVLVDVRTEAELSWVGYTNLADLGKEALRAEWKTFPGMEPNMDFTRQVSDAVENRDTPMLFLCRSGGRSKSAAEVMTAAGYTRCYNIAGGFEGDKNGDGHRGTVNGWKAEGLPWLQG